MVRQMCMRLAQYRDSNALRRMTIARTVPVYQFARDAFALDSLIARFALSAEEADMMCFAHSFGLYF